MGVELNGGRREFLIGTGAAALAAASVAWPLAATAAPARYPLGIQFFTFNALAVQGWPKFSEAMGLAKQIGYDSVQFAGLMGHAPDLVRKRAEALGLALRSIHIGNDQVRAFRAPGGGIGEAQDAVYTPTGIVQVARVNVPLARDLGCEWAVLGASGPANMRSIANVRRMCDALNSANEIARSAGIGLSYHGHGADFSNVEGQIPFEVMIANTDPSIRYELDVAWVAAGGADPVALIDRHAKRIVSFHLKDRGKNGKAATPGDGVIDFAAIHRAAAQIQGPIFHVECEGGAGVDLVREASRSLQYLRRLGWGNAA